MIGVVLAAPLTDTKMRRQFPALLRRVLPPEAEGIPVCGVENQSVLLWNPVIVLCRNTDALPAGFFCGKQGVAVVDAQGSASTLEAVRKSKLPAVTCGMASCDTITMSSRSSGSAVITVQRNIPRFDGSIAEPQEIPIHTAQRADDFLLMALAAVCLLTGNESALICSSI